MRVALALLLLLGLPLKLQAQLTSSPTIDSLHRLLENSTDESLSSEVLNELSYFYVSIDTAQSIAYGQEALRLAIKTSNYEEVCTYYENLSRYLIRFGRYDAARTAYLKAQEYLSLIDENTLNERKLKKKKARIQEGIGVSYRRQGNYARALEYYLQALSIREQIESGSSIASSYNNIGVLYFYQDNYQKAYEFYSKAKNTIPPDEIKESLRGAVLLNLGEALFYLKRYSEALEHYQESLSIFKLRKDANGIAYCHNGIGEVYAALNELDKAKVYLEDALTIREDLGETDNTAVTLNTLGKVYQKEKRHNTAIAKFNKAIEKAESIGYPDPIKDAYEGLSESYAKVGDYKNAHHAHINFKIMADSLRNEEQIKKLARLESEYTFEKDRLKFEEEAVIQENKQIATYIVLGVVSILAVLAVFFLLDKQKSNRKLATAKRSIENSHEELKTAYEEIHSAQEELYVLNEALSDQRDSLQTSLQTIQIQQKKIMGSINYAERIQKAVLPSAAKLKDALPNHFVLFKPRDIVSGDFYWMHHDKYRDRVTVVVADCTGHGVPGAFMSMVGNDLLHYAVKERGTEHPDLILEQMRESIESALNQKESSNKDGMELGVMCIDFKEQLVEFAGARRPLIYIQDGELHTLKGDYSPVGGQQQTRNTSFIRRIVSFHKPTCFYMLSDGLQDQFGGPHGRKFMIKNIKRILLEIYHLPMEEQKEELDRQLKSWMKDEKQVDDILMMGIKL